MKTVTILGQPYTIELVQKETDRNLQDGGDAYCDWTTHRIVLQDPEEVDGSFGNMSAYWKRTLRHEIIHAFLYESGLDANSMPVEAWARNEEMVDWFAAMFPKLIVAFEKADCL